MKRLFWEDPYMKGCKAKVKSVDGKGVELEGTCFFAFSGGQQSDSGSIGGIPVVNAEKKGDTIVYILEREPEFGEGDTVDVEIDWEKRNRIMRLHSAAHIVWFFAEKKLATRKLIGSNVTEEKARIDYEYPESLAPLLPGIEGEVNVFISESHPIKTYADEGDPMKRWLECGEFRCPCGGTHLRDAKEIGKIKLKRKNIGGGKERIEITLA